VKGWKQNCVMLGQTDGIGSRQRRTVINPVYVSADKAFSALKIVFFEAKHVVQGLFSDKFMG